MTPNLRAGALVALALALPGVMAAQQQSRTIYVNAADSSGAPVLDLTAADFGVQENGTERPVTSVSLAKGPMRIMVMVDTSGQSEPWQSAVKTGLAGFIDAIPAEHEIGIVTIGRQFRVRADPTTDRVKLKDAASKLGIDGGGNVLAEGLLETETRFQKKKEVSWPVYLIVTTDAVMNTSMQTEELTRIMNDLMLRGTTVHVASLQNSGPSLTTDIAMALAKNTGGSFNLFTTSNALPEKLKTMATQIADDHRKMSTRYQLQYTSGVIAGGAGVNVSIRRPGVIPTLSFKRPF